jgi:hypothetical protein
MGEEASAIPRSKQQAARRVKRLWKASVGLARTIVSEHWHAIERVAAALLAHGTLRQDDIDELLRA